MIVALTLEDGTAFLNPDGGHLLIEASTPDGVTPDERVVTVEAEVRTVIIPRDAPAS